jgi:hypothetical protein
LYYLYDTIIPASDTRLLEITHLYLDPPRVPTPVQEEQEDDQTEIPDSMVSTIASEADVTTEGIPTKQSTGSFHFMQASELESSFEETAEWVERPDPVVQEPEESDRPRQEPLDSASDGDADHYIGQADVPVSSQEVNATFFPISLAWTETTWRDRHFLLLQLTGQMKKGVYRLSMYFKPSSALQDLLHPSLLLERQKQSNKMLPLRMKFRQMVF